jgi:hypothetical protein
MNVTLEPSGVCRVHTAFGLPVETILRQLGTDSPLYHFFNSRETLKKIHFRELISNVRVHNWDLGPCFLFAGTTTTTVNNAAAEKIVVKAHSGYSVSSKGTFPKHIVFNITNTKLVASGNALIRHNSHYITDDNWNGPKS